MPPFSGIAAIAIDQATMHRKAAANPSSQNDAEYNIMATPRTQIRFSHGKTVCIIAHINGKLDLLLQVFGKIRTMNCGNIRGNHGAISRIDDTGDRNGNGFRRIWLLRNPINQAVEKSFVI